MTEVSKSKGLIRMGLMGGAFIALTVVLIVFQPGSPRHASVEPLPESSVTRVAPALDDLNTQLPATQAPVAQAPEVTPVQTVIAPPSQTSPPTSMRDMTFVAISNLKSATTGEAPAPGEPGSLLHSVVKRSLSATANTATTQTPSVTVANTAPQPQTPRSYFVRPGDTLGSIAQEVYGDVTMASELFARNAAILNRPDELRAGMVLELP